MLSQNINTPKITNTFEVGATFSSFKDFTDSLNAYSKATFQNFIKGDSLNYLPHDLSDLDAKLAMILYTNESNTIVFILGQYANTKEKTVHDQILIP